MRRGRPAAALLVFLASCASNQSPAAVHLDTAAPLMTPQPVGTVAVASSASTLHYTITGLQPDSVHPVFAIQGTCGDSGAIQVATLHADGGGGATGDLAMPSLPHAAGATTGTVVVGLTVRVGPGVSVPAEAAPLACAEVVVPGGLGIPATVTPMPPFNAAKASAHLSYDPSTRVLTVTVRATGLAPGSRHPNHIHTGQCESAGPVRDTLRTLVADAQGNAEATTRIPESDGIKHGAWYVAIHSGPGLETQAQYALLACGNVASGGSPLPA